MKKIIYFLFVLYPAALVLFSVLSKCSPTEIDLDRKFLPPSFSFPLGTNELGQDLACMIGYGTITSLTVSFISALLSFFIGTVLGMLAGYFGGIYDILISRMIEFFQGLPALIFVIFIVSVFGGGDDKVIIALSAFGWTSFARIARNETARIKKLEFVNSAYILGLPQTKILKNYIFPFILNPLITQFMFSFSAFMLAEGGLGFLGLRPAEKISLGSIIADEMDFILTKPELVIFPGLSLTSLCVFLNLVGQKMIEKQKGVV